MNDRVYANYRTSQGNTNVDDRAVRAPYIRRLIKRHVPRDLDSRILDLGCGSGTILHFLNEAGYHRTSGVDISAEQVALAQSLGVAGVSQGDLLQVLAGARSAEYDVVVTFDVLEHMAKNDALRLADEISRVLSPGGRWIIHVPNATSFFGAHARYADWSHENAFTSESLAQLTKIAGFTRCEVHEDKPIVHGPLSAVRRTIWTIARSLIALLWIAEKGAPGKGRVFSQNLLGIAVK